MNERTPHVVAAALAMSAAALITIATPGTARAADDSLVAARDLYASAAYEEALTALNHVRASGVGGADAFAVEQYRAFCLLALGRAAEAQKSIETLVVSDPLYQPSADLSPRVRTAFTEVRRRLLPSIIPQEYTQAKESYDRKDYAAAAAGFSQVLSVLSDPDVGSAAGQPPLADVRTLATGFQELALKAAAPPPAPVSAPVPQLAVAPAPAPPRIYAAADANVVAPSAIKQELPAFSGRLSAAAIGALEVTIDERGWVESATIRQSVNASYDRLALDAARNWRYKPATVDGAPVKFRKIIQITLKPTS